MECFSHQGVTAVGICKSCGKGVCHACAISVPRGIACCEECRTFVESLSRLQAASVRNLGLISAQRIIQPLFALIFLATGIWAFQDGGGLFAWFLIAVGVVMALSAGMTWRNRNARKVTDVR